MTLFQTPDQKKAQQETNERVLAKLDRAMADLNLLPLEPHEL